jgi:hypothetical protein
MEPFAQLVGLVMALCTALSRDHDTRGCHAGEAGQADPLPRNTHGP